MALSKKPYTLNHKSPTAKHGHFRLPRAESAGRSCRSREAKLELRSGLGFRVSGLGSSAGPFKATTPDLTLNGGFYRE